MVRGGLGLGAAGSQAVRATVFLPFSCRVWFLETRPLLSTEDVLVGRATLSTHQHLLTGQRRSRQ